MNALPESYRGGGIFEEQAWFNRTVARMLNHFRVFGRGRVVVTRTGIDLYIDNGSNSAEMAFYTSVSGANVTIKAGNVWGHQQGSGPWAMAETTLALAGSPCWVYIKWLRSGATPTAQVATTTMPNSTPTYLMWPLCKYVSSGSTWVRSGQRCWAGDIPA